MLVPEVAQGAAGDLAELRMRCDEAVARLLEHAGERVTVLGTAATAARWDAAAGGSLAGLGVDVRAGGPEAVLPLPLTIGAWLLDRAGWQGGRTYVAVTGQQATGLTDAVLTDAVLVMADGTAKRADASPGSFDDRAAVYDKLIAQALADGDAPALAGLDLDLGEQLWAGGAPALRSLGASVGPRSIDARLAYDDAPFGVGYFVAEWSVAAP